MTKTAPIYYEEVACCVDDVLETVGPKVVLGIPLGLGKPNHFVNEIYRRAVEDSRIDLTICTALSLERPHWSNDLERRFLEPFIQRMFEGYVDLDYVSDMRRDRVPPNIRIKEFYTKAGSLLNVRHAQQYYISSNYTHASRDSLDSGVNVAAQMVCRGEVQGQERFSLSCNPDVSLDVAKALAQQKRQGRGVAIIGQINQNLPFMYGDAVVDPSVFTGVIDNPAYHFRLFGAPKLSVSTTDYLIGLYATSLIQDGGTLQIGIGSLGDALCYGLQLRQQQNEVYCQALTQTHALENFGDLIEQYGGTTPFDEGLLGSTEMLVDGYLHLMRCGVVRRKSYNHPTLQRLSNEKKLNEEVTPQTLDLLLESGAIHHHLTAKDVAFLQEYGILQQDWGWQEGELRQGERRITADLDDPQCRKEINRSCLGKRLQKGILIHGGFFLGPESFYKELQEMSEEERQQIHMTSVLNVNQLYENEYGSEELRVLQRRHGRFVNACLMVTLAGGVVSDGLDNGQMVSGVGGQYNFVSQAHALPDGRSILMCKSTRTKGKKVSSNIVFNYGHITIPRHLRDVVITEYGIADLRGQSDKDVMASLLQIADSRFQDELLQQARDSGKIPANYQIPERFRQNYPQRLEDELAPFRREGHFPPFPFGTDFTGDELIIAKALKSLKAKMSQGLKKISSLSKAMTIRTIPPQALPYLQRLQLDNPTNSKERMMQKLVVHALADMGQI